MSELPGRAGRGFAPLAADRLWQDWLALFTDSDRRLLRIEQLSIVDCKLERLRQPVGASATKDGVIEIVRCEPGSTAPNDAEILGVCRSFDA